MYKNLSYDINVNLVLGLNLQLHIQLRVFFANLLSNADIGLYSSSMFLDLSKSFDTV